MTAVSTSVTSSFLSFPPLDFGGPIVLFRVVPFFSFSFFVGGREPAAFASLLVCFLVDCLAVCDRLLYCCNRRLVFGLLILQQRKQLRVWIFDGTDG